MLEQRTFYPPKPTFTLKIKPEKQTENKKPYRPSKINLQKEENFQRPRKCVFLTTFHQQSTTISPSKNHVLHTTFRKNPRKNTPSTTPTFFLPLP
jgi:hypothetical protein